MKTIVISTGLVFFFFYYTLTTVSKVDIKTFSLYPINKHLETKQSNSNSEDQYWFYINSHHSGVVFYSQVLKCHQKVTTPGAYVKDDAVGPFKTYKDASSAKSEEVKLLIESGAKTKFKTAICDDRWK